MNAQVEVISELGRFISKEYDYTDQEIIYLKEYCKIGNDTLKFQMETNEGIVNFPKQVIEKSIVILHINENIEQ